LNWCINDGGRLTPVQRNSSIGGFVAGSHESYLYVLIELQIVHEASTNHKLARQSYVHAHFFLDEKVSKKSRLKSMEGLTLASRRMLSVISSLTQSFLCI
jgi:hypothetical protein